RRCGARPRGGRRGLLAPARDAADEGAGPRAGSGNSGRGGGADRISGTDREGDLWSRHQRDDDQRHHLGRRGEKVNMRKLPLALVFASSLVVATASADGPTTATFVNTQVSSTNCPPGSAAGQLGYKCSIPKPGASASLALRTPSNTTLPDGRIVQLVL